MSWFRWDEGFVELVHYGSCIGVECPNCSRRCQFGLDPHVSSIVHVFRPSVSFICLVVGVHCLFHCVSECANGVVAPIHGVAIVPASLIVDAVSFRCDFMV